MSKTVQLSSWELRNLFIELNEVANKWKAEKPNEIESSANWAVGMNLAGDQLLAILKKYNVHME